jgi:nitroreductase
MTQPEHEALEGAARDALHAPSVFNTQPWAWRVDGAALELRADRGRQLETIDPHGHFLLLSCGAALHHARIALASGGWITEEERLRPDDGGDLLARICVVGRKEPGLDALRLHDAMFRRRTDRRPFGDEPVSEADRRMLVLAAAAEGVRAHPVGLSQMPMLAIAVATAASIETADPAYRSELIRWTNRPEWSHDGVPADTAVQKVPRRVPVREFAVAPNEGLPVEPGGDRGALYLILHGDGDAPIDWLRAGEALSAVLLTAVSRGLAVAPITDVLEVAHPRELIAGLAGEGQCPYVVIRCGHAVDDSTLAAAPRRDSTEVIDGQLGW